MTTLIRWSLLAISLAAPVYATPLSTSPYYVPHQRPPLTFAPLMVSHHPHGTINNSYIVMLKDDLPPSLTQNHFNFLQMAHETDPLVGDQSGIRHVYDGHIKGYSGHFTDGVVEQIRTMPEVDFVERDQVVHTMELQTGAPWGLARISHRSRLRLGTFSKYEYNVDGGKGVDVYVIDTGINIEHVEFQGRASWGKTIPLNDIDIDGNGHGTHCAGTIASAKYGVAKAAQVIAVKVLGTNGSGTMSDVIAGVGWATTQAAKKAAAALAEFEVTGTTRHKGSVANMSLGGGKSKALDNTVNKAVSAGLHFSVAAGNDDKDACQYSPAAAEQAVTVGASTLQDDRAYFSNHGPCVDVFAPGLNILSAYIGSPTATSSLSGTSMASPHVAGLLAYLLSIYPSNEFDPDITEHFTPITLQTQRTFITSPLMYSIAHAMLPRWVSELFPLPEVINRAPVPRRPETLSPLQLKKALIALSSKDLLSPLPPDTVNRLVFNNATAS